MPGRRRSGSRSRSSGRRLGRGRSKRGSCPLPRVNPRTGRVTKYLGHRVKDVKGAGLDSPEEYRGILREILRDYRAGCISERTACGRLLLLYRLTFPEHNSKASRIPAKVRQELRREIKRAMERL